MDLLKKLKSETIENLAELWEDKKFQELVKVLRLNQENFAKLCLTRTKWEDIQQLQYYASAFSLIIKTVEDAARKVENLPKKRRKK